MLINLGLDVYPLLKGRVLLNREGSLRWALTTGAGSRSLIGRTHEKVLSIDINLSIKAVRSKDALIKALNSSLTGILNYP